MPNGNRSSRVAIVGLLGALTFTALGTGAYYGALYAPNERNQATISADNAANGEYQTSQQIDRDRAGLPDFAERMIGGTDPRDTQEREQRDLAAQESMAVWAFWLLAISVITTVATIIGTIALIWTLHETRLTARRELRAYVSAQVKGMELHADTGQAEIHIEVSNGGQTPAFKCVWAGNVVISTPEQLEKDLRATPRRPTGERRGSPAAIHGGQVANGSIYNHKPFTTEQLQEAISGDKAILVFGFVWYDDAFDNPRESTFCYQSGLLPPPEEVFTDPVRYEAHWTMTPFFNDAT